MSLTSSTRPRLREPVRAAVLAVLMTATLAWAQQSPADKQLATLLADQKWSEALSVIDGQLRSRPNDAQLLMNKGAVLANMNRNAEALAIFQRVAQANPQLPAAHNNMAVILAANGKYEEARASLEKAIRTHPAYATAYENLGDLYSHMAGDAYRKALQIDKNLKTAKPKLEMVSELTALVAGGAAAGAATAASGSFASAAGTPLPGAPAAGGTRVAQAPTPAPAPAATPAAPAPAPRPAAPAAAPAPAPAAATPPAPAPAPAPAARPAAPAADTTAADVESALKAWARAWSSRDMKAYAAAYTPDFKGSQASRSEWLQARTAVIVPRKRIDVDVSDVQVKVDGDRARVSFRQDYSSDGRDIRSRKSIVMQKVGGRWLIREESGR